MQEKWSFQIKKIDGKALSSTISSVLEENQKDLGIFLSYYFKREGAVVEQVLLKEVPDFYTENSGRLILEFDLVHFNACLAIHEQKREEMKVDFLIDPLTLKLTLKGPYWPERGMDDI
ncbi:hypothetical protein JYB62_04260 [Algoriphagus lutimaris]|uniref:hypothetical protein n=1 Tax=Algoriphagus lutimaris TaxID=613197 RepID=UPI00196A210A|nr:hypothetical protein [Algoriphagus lutimaris]MBN3519206.1 hypothetical protein [Algoriphagus lutimaris]